jgi:hypothetical protein
MRKNPEKSVTDKVDFPQVGGKLGDDSASGGIAIDELEVDYPVRVLSDRSKNGEAIHGRVLHDTKPPISGFDRGEVRMTCFKV